MPIVAHPYDVYAWYTLSLDFLKNPTFNIYSFPRAMRAKPGVEKLRRIPKEAQIMSFRSP